MSVRLTGKDKIRNLFGNIAGVYDAGNNLISFGTHKRYKKKAIESLDLKPGKKFIDLCTGTGDMALQAASHLPSGDIFGIDFSEEMIGRAITRSEKKGLNINFLIEDVTELPFTDGSFDAASMAFGLRNIPDKAGALSEVYRVLKKGGNFAVLEFAPPSDSEFPSLYRFYLERIVPPLGWLISRNYRAYKYLTESVEEFPTRVEVMNMAEEIGFTTSAKTFLTGALSLYNFLKL